jgi:hypothetical protein
MDGQGGIAAISSSGDIWTAHAASRSYTRWIFLACAVLAAGIAWWWWKRGYSTL